MYDTYKCVFFFNDTATTEIYTLSLHDALPIWPPPDVPPRGRRRADVELHVRARDVSLSARERRDDQHRGGQDRKSTRLNSSHANISYAVFCLKKKNKINHE